MTASANNSVADAHLRELPESLWLSMLFRALPVIAGALVIAFTPDHSPRFGFAVFGAVALWSGIIVGFEAVGIKNHPLRPVVFARSIITAVAGGFALFMATGGHDWATPGAFILTIAIWGIVTGLLELVGVPFARKHRFYTNEIIISGALTLLLGVIVAFVPPDLDEAYGGVEQITGSLTASVQAVGFVGAYFAVLGVLLVIEAITLRQLLRRAHETPTLQETAQ
ncbi:hypothetical protein EG850_07805 [Gulosibacter macacae]|uniref:Uncharacterized protein n=1 Tax=Gulosibacter macacae TaxID=2488791 RepID=A0A3P3VUR0_9MICO|nr:hypothetical protein [Gulosibacter macacae]RRJ86545.1 hypothetical protein EG850_07805 [Gulosibacter macacae]